MNLEFSKLIREIETEIAMEYIPGAIRWVDERTDGGWSKAIDRFDLALSEAIRTKNFSYAKQEAEIYRDSILRFVSDYKKQNRIQEADNFLDAVKSQ